MLNADVDVAGPAWLCDSPSKVVLILEGACGFVCAVVGDLFVAVLYFPGPVELAPVALEVDLSWLSESTLPRIEPPPLPAVGSQEADLLAGVRAVQLQRLVWAPLV